jgi:hypothetical protein
MNFLKGTISENKGTIFRTKGVIIFLEGASTHSRPVPRYGEVLP